MPRTQNTSLDQSDRLPSDWRKRISAYTGITRKHFLRVMEMLSQWEWLDDDQRRRAAFVLVEKARSERRGR